VTAKLMIGSAIGSTLALLVGLCCLGGSASPSQAAAATTGSSVCATTGPLAGLSSVAAANARIVVSVAESEGGPKAAVIAVAVGLDESGLRTLGNVDGQQGNIAVQGLGSDHDSIGIFQQRPPWGTVTQRLDPAQSTGLFVGRLLADPGWQNKAPWVAAQDVQASGVSDGSNYRRFIDQASEIVAAVDKDSQALTCGGVSDAEAANTMAGSRGLPSDYTIPANASHGAVLVITFAIAQLDKPYVFDAAGPAAFDCSGLTMAAWAKAGVSLPHYSVTQADAGTATSSTAIRPGDLVLVPGDDGTIAAPGHVGIYLGHGLVLNAADEQMGILVQTFADFVSVGHGLSAIRHIA
jgi:cell wall-associated NlpC family hydrolase